jgi:DNA invertase Pin-like site-specific DNA recombinase
MRVALYARVSTKDKSQNPETQLMPMREFAKAKQYSIVGEYVDVGWSGAKERRPQLDRLMRDMQKGQFEAVLVARFDRFARSTAHLLNALAEFERKKVDFISIAESIDTSTPVGKMVFTILGAVAEMERALIKERVLAGMQRARREGKTFGRPTVLYDRVKVIERLARGETVSQIARETGISRPTVRAIRKSLEFLSPGETLPRGGGEKPLAGRHVSDDAVSAD